ncbi:hypothetical protein COV61_05225 [Candidatus Micrarchaeota archaeon CG11_big_fil_rev_8_21_14_0_20_47_5]|nr:MAG: hypothetical protein AUJ17_02380 [Candidatus Micrarchaeota archaeon CG1_02_47_40]PIN82697.1 MAG: hypothetical protein COV61_05225 [Candidatus Micrarchaeota archaeon CG11_big_fil_rev_8_21_14_0_20_47_5]
MDLGWGNPKAGKFATSPGLITSSGINGQNIMAAEWTYYVSFSPALISVHIGGGLSDKATSENITKSKEFGVNIASEEQSIICSIAGASSGREVDKISLLKELGVEFYPAKKINALMLSGSALNAECRLLESRVLGDHTAFIGEVLEIESNPLKKPLLYSFGKYYSLGEQIAKPEKKMIERIEELEKKYRKK